MATVAATKSNSSKAKHRELKVLAANVKNNIFDMLRLASELLLDSEYVDEFGGEHRLMDALESNEFSHFGGSPSLASLIRAYRKNPDRQVWREYKDNVRAMIELASDRGESEEVERINWKAQAKQLEIRVSQLESSLKESRDLNERLVQENKVMHERVGEMVGQVKVLEQLRR